MDYKVTRLHMEQIKSLNLANDWLQPKRFFQGVVSWGSLKWEGREVIKPSGEVGR